MPFSSLAQALDSIREKTIKEMLDLLHELPEDELRILHIKMVFIDECLRNEQQRRERPQV